MTTTLGAITPGRIISQPSDNFQDIYVLTTFDDRVLAEVLPYDVLMGEAEANAALYCDAHNTAHKTGKLPSQLLQERDELVGALEWLTHIGYGVGKRGGHPESGEIEQALTEARTLLSKYNPKP